MKIAIATDHTGILKKKEIIKVLEKKYEILDLSKDNFDLDDYPDYAIKVGEAVINKAADFGILMCGTGIGISISANKIKGIYCALIKSKEDARLAKEHNGANVLAFSSKQSIDEIVDALDEYIGAKIDMDERHIRRREKVIKIESGEYNEL